MEVGTATAPGCAWLTTNEDGLVATHGSGFVVTQETKWSAVNQERHYGGLRG